jgi:hypothetical protein
MVLPDQFIDLTKRRESTFFGQGAVAHVSMAQPVCPASAGSAGAQCGACWHAKPRPWRHPARRRHLCALKARSSSSRAD